MQLTPNLVVEGRFCLVRQIGRGGMGTVWQARHLTLDTDCAIKFIEGEYAKTAEARQRFEREARAAAQLRSPNVVQIFDHGGWEGIPFIVMELLDGEDLGRRIARHGGRVPPADLCRILAQVSRALTKAHQVGIVHRDLKPENIFLVRDDDREVAKILDFGIAKQTTALGDSNTKTGAMLGTPYYMSPEQAQGTKSVDPRSDLWSLAVIVYQCVTGRLPFESKALGDLLVKIIVQPLPVPSRVAPGVPPTFDAWWARASSREPAGRFQTAREFVEALSLALGQSQVLDGRDGATTYPSITDGRPTAPMGAPPAFQGQPTPDSGAHRHAAAYQGHRPPQPSYSSSAAYLPAAVGPAHASVPGVQAVAHHHPSVPGLGGTYGGASVAVKKSGGGLAVAGVLVAFLVIGGGVAGLVVVRSRAAARQVEVAAPPPPSAEVVRPDSPPTAATVDAPASTAADASAVASAGPSARPPASAAADPRKPNTQVRPKVPAAPASARPTAKPAGSAKPDFGF